MLKSRLKTETEVRLKTLIDLSVVSEMIRALTYVILTATPKY